MVILLFRNVVSQVLGCGGYGWYSGARANPGRASMTSGGVAPVLDGVEEDTLFARR